MTTRFWDMVNDISTRHVVVRAAGNGVETGGWQFVRLKV